jgi:hypothetical protein
MTSKKLEIQLAPTGAGGHATTDAKDHGFLVRVSPSELIPGVRDVLRVDLAYGKSELSYENDPVIFLNEDQANHVSEHERRGDAGRVSLDRPGLAERMAGPAWMWEGLQPLVSFGYADDHSRIGVAPSARYETDGNGWEITLADVLSYRQGHYEDLLGGIDGDTGGWGVGIPIGTIAGVRYDHATFPQASDSDLPDLERHSASAWIDAVRVWRLPRPDG